MGKKILKLFLDTMLRAAVILLAIAIIVMLVLLAKTMNKNKTSDDTSTKEASSIVTEEADPSDPTFNSDADASDADADVASDAAAEDTQTDETSAKVVVINASGVSGVAGTWQSTLTSAGYASVEVGNYLGETQSATTIYVSGSYSGTGLSSNFSNASIGQKSDLDSSLFNVLPDGSGATIDDFDIVVLVGTDNASGN